MNRVLLILCCIAAVVVWRIAPALRKTSPSQNAALSATSAPIPVGITAALLQQDETLLVDARDFSPRDLPVPGALRVAQLNARDERRPLIVIGAPNAVRRLQKTHRVTAFVPPFTLSRDAGLPPQWEISGAQLQRALRKRALRVLDVREEHEFRVSRIPGSARVSMFDVAAKIDPEKPVAIFCLTGHRSAFVVRQLRVQGFTNVFSVRGGWLDWKAQKRPLRAGQNEEASTR